MYYVYFLSLDQKVIYKGLTTDLKRRIGEHKRGKVKSTSRYEKIQLVGYEAYLLKSDAFRRERFLKTSEGRRLFKQQYRDFLKQLNVV